MNDYVFKPIDENQFFDTLARWIKPKKVKSRHLIRVWEPVPEITDETIDIPELPGLDSDRHLRVMGNKEITGGSVLISNNEKEAVANILEAMNKDQIDEVKKAVHSLKGVSGNIGAEGLYRSLIEAEELIKTGSMESAKEKIKEAADLHNVLVDVIERWKNSLKISMNPVLYVPGVFDKEQAVKFF